MKEVIILIKFCWNKIELESLKWAHYAFNCAKVQIDGLVRLMPISSSQT
jgi:hypothetical protein